MMIIISLLIHLIIPVIISPIIRVSIPAIIPLIIPLIISLILPVIISITIPTIMFCNHPCAAAALPMVRRAASVPDPPSELVESCRMGVLRVLPAGGSHGQPAATHPCQDLLARRRSVKS